jgi:stalled ribosome rescue protein Dom34
MRNHKLQGSTSEPSRTDTEFDREFHDFFESVTVTKEELAAIVSMPGFSRQEVKDYLREKNQTNHLMTNVSAKLRELQGWFERGWGYVAATFATLVLPKYHARDERKT